MLCPLYSDVVPRYCGQWHSLLDEGRTRGVRSCLTWNSKASCREGIYTSSSKNIPVAGLITPACFRAFIIISVRYLVVVHLCQSRWYLQLEWNLTGKREINAWWRRRCCPNLPLIVCILSQLWSGYFSFNKSTRSGVFTQYGNPTACASEAVTVSQSSG